MSGLRGFISTHIMDLGEPTPKVAPVTTPPVGQAYAPPISQNFVPVKQDLVNDMTNELLTSIRQKQSAFSSLDEKTRTMMSAGLTEEQATKAAFALLKAEGKTTPAVISALDAHISEINTCIGQFAIGAQTSNNQHVSTLKNQIGTLESQIATDESLVQQLTAQISQLKDACVARTAEISVKKNEIVAAESEINGKIAAFNTAAENIKASLSSKKIVLSSMLS